MKQIRRERFEAVSYARKTAIMDTIGIEVAWFANDKETVLGTVIHDLSDNDFGFVTLGRDESGLFRAIDTDASFKDPDECIDALEKSIMKNESKGENFPQGDKKANR